MSAGPAIITQGKFEWFTIAEHGITFDPNISKEAWLGIVAKFCALFEGAVLTREKALMFLADALNAGEQFFGEEFAQSISASREYLGLSPKTIANAQWTYKRIPSEKRKIGITLGHYSIIAALDPEEQDRYCEQILTHRYTLSDLREVVATDHPKTKRGQNRKTAEDDDKSILQKLEDCSHYLKDHKATEPMKFHLAALHLAYRRKWQPGTRK